jgi:hypothetical protein
MCSTTPDDSCVLWLRNGAAKSACVRLAKEIAVERCGKSVQRDAVVLDEGKARWLQIAFHIDIPMPVRESQYISARRYDGDCAPCSPHEFSGAPWLDSCPFSLRTMLSAGQPSPPPLTYPVWTIYPPQVCRGKSDRTSCRSPSMASQGERLLLLAETARGEYLQLFNTRRPRRGMWTTKPHLTRASPSCQATRRIWPHARLSLHAYARR